MFWPTLRKFF